MIPKDDKKTRDRRIIYIASYIRTSSQLARLSSLLLPDGVETMWREIFFFFMYRLGIYYLVKSVDTSESWARSSV